MTTAVEWFHSKINCLNDLHDVTAKKDLITQIKIKFLGLNSRESAEVSRDIDYECLFMQLNDDNSDYTEEVCDLIRALLERSKIEDIYRKYSEDMVKLVNAENWMVRVMFLQQLQRNSITSSMLLENKNLIVAIIKKIGDENLTVAKLAMSIINKLGSAPQALPILFTGSCFSALCHLLTVNDTVSLRVYETVVNVAKTTKDGFEAVVNSGLLHSFLKYLDSDDLIVQLNALEILGELISTNDGLVYLEQHDIIWKLVNLLKKSEEDDISTLLIPGLLKFFGTVGTFCPEVLFTKYPMVVTSIFEYLETKDLTLLGIALDTLGSVASSTESKYSLCAMGNHMSRALAKISDILQTSTSELKVRALNCLALILNVKKIDQDNKILALTNSWFDSLCENSMQLILSLCKQPFCDIRHAALKVLGVVASQAWGQEYIAADPEIVEFIVDKSIEEYKQCREAKYEIVEYLSNTAPDIFGAETSQRFKEYVYGGIYASGE